MCAREKGGQENVLIPNVSVTLQASGSCFTYSVMVPFSL